ncbi:hypothetical protein Syn7803C58_245 [Synechococcus phage ACG-2014f]|uniref:Uncharacterized protein n=3 Tax=Atlauavirus TaxID=2733092 RepID=A0A0E3IAF5_9CAUD|nr:hypothetical protein AAJ63_gp252 [Synechococcus phage ACG-2014f]YP_009778402.1 hypothetical protein HOQ61_gp248 [Synechococcus phage ACG-2014f_Syn7803C7]AIX16770.1 hypothetical protein Syn7803C58_245 [Synechococcus phage ACG-2014f]AIX18547.1 hypothetical protein Syn7803C6_248 [Synechococcus phage ACG-2014f]AIX20139.1 hypothetical protein Syn7803C7_248 [Synechococcus phage ACG-2014f_Syn7803C7]AIX20426.1 hypothetical protein Syn7803C80_249 [Synechococcus phage ACG-2014f]AIX21863.1 hypothetic
MDERIRTLYVFQSDDRLITHDGHVQLGCHNMTMEKFMSFDRENIRYIETYWLPDVFGNRYKRSNFQAHQRVSGEKGVLELSNNQPGNRLDRSV